MSLIHYCNFTLRNNPAKYALKNLFAFGQKVNREWLKKLHNSTYYSTLHGCEYCSKRKINKHTIPSSRKSPSYLLINRFLDRIVIKQGNC